jgi:hypothetical protein
MKVYHVVISYVLLGIAVPAFLHVKEHGKLNIYHLLVAFFCSLNILICFWEISLGFYIKHIETEYNSLKKRFKSNQFDAVIEFFFTNVGSNLFSMKFWSKVWSTYSLYDPSYSNKESYGFFIDVGNGWSTLIPSFLFMMGLTYDILPARALGIIGVLKFYQEFYGTILYFLSYIRNGRYKDRSFLEVALFVGLSNGLWFAFPLLGMYLSVSMIYSDSYALFR